MLQTVLDNSCLVTPRAKSSCLVTHSEKPVLGTVVRGHEKGIPAVPPFLALCAESLDF